MKAVFKVTVNGTDISNTLAPVLNSLRVSDRAGVSNDSASLELDDTDGRLILPPPKASIEIQLGWEGQGVGVVFRGVVDEVRADGGRGGRTVSVSAKGMDTRGKAKQPQRKHFDDKTISEALQSAGQDAGITVKVDQELGSKKRKYLSLDDESFVAFGERIAREVGGTFKIVGDQAVLAKRNGGVSAGGAALASVSAVWGKNLHDYSISPILGRPVEKQARARWYDPKKAEWQEKTADTGTDGGETIKTSRYSVNDEDVAGDQSEADAAESDRRSGEGSVTIEGNIGAQPEGTCVLQGCRPGVDGTYRIEGVDHEYSRGGFTTRLELGQPKGEAGKDKRGKNSTSGDDGDPVLPTDPDLG